MVLRFLLLILFFIFGCADFERDSAYDVDGGSAAYKLCGSSYNRYHLDTQFCYEDRVYDLSTYEPCGSGSIYRLDMQFCYEDEVYRLCNGSDYTPSVQRCENGVVETACGTSWYNAAIATLRCQNNVVETGCGTGWFDAETQFCYDNRIEQKCGNRPEAFDTGLYGCEGNKIYLKTPVLHEDKSYEAVLIGDKTWMSENLNYEVDGSVCYGEGGRVISGDDLITLSESEVEANCDAYGRLYSLEMAIGNICPSSWHLPSYDEWNALINSGVVGNYSFAAGGIGFPGGSLFEGIDERGYWWSLDAYSLEYDGSDVSLSDNINEDLLLSVRCVKD